MGYGQMSERFIGELRESEVPWEVRFGGQFPRTNQQPPKVHTLPPADTRQFAYGEFRNSPTNNYRLEFPKY